MKMSKIVFVVLVVCFGCLDVSAETAATCDVIERLDCSAPAANEEGEWQFGVGVAATLNIPEYIGSDEKRDYFLPVPYVVYNGPRLKISQSGISGKLFNSERWFLTLSLSGAIPVDSDSNNARRGMNDLDAVFEYGPSLKYFFWGNDSSSDALFFDFNFREARTIELDSLQLSSSPGIAWRNKLDKDYFDGQLSFSGSFRFEFVSDKYANYFYGVDSLYATETRSEFKASGGFAGFRTGHSVRWQKGNQIVSFFMAYADINDAEYVDSPLVKTKQHFYAGSAYFWLF